MSIRSAVYTLLSGLESDVWPLVAEQETSVPYGVYFLSRTHILSQDGVEVKEVRLRIEIYGNDWDDVAALAATLEADLDIKDETAIGGEQLMVSYLTSEDENYLPGEQKFNITQEYILKFE